MVELKSSIMAFQEQYYEDIPDCLDLIEEGDWPLLISYVKAVAPFVKATEMFSGGNYITSSRVIPVLDQMSTDLTSLCSSPDTERDVKNLANHLLQGLRRRFPSNYQNLAPYNCLTFLDPRFVDLYADTPELMSTVNDACYDTMDTVVAPEPAPAAGSSSSTAPPASDRRSQLLKKKMASQASGSGSNQEEDEERVLPLKEKIRREIKRFKTVTPIDQKLSPSKWWKENEQKFPLLARYFKLNSSFQATSVASERVFGIDTFTMTDHRQSMAVKRSSNMVFVNIQELSEDRKFV